MAPKSEEMCMAVIEQGGQLKRLSMDGGNIDSVTDRGHFLAADWIPGG